MESSEYNDNNTSPPNYFDRGIFCKGGFFHPLLSGYTKQPHNFLCDVISSLFLVSIMLSSSWRSLQAQYIRTEYDGLTYC